MKHSLLSLIAVLLVDLASWGMGGMVAIAAPANSPCPSDMVYIPGGTFAMGSDNPDFVERKSLKMSPSAAFASSPTK